MNTLTKYRRSSFLSFRKRRTPARAGSRSSAFTGRRGAGARPARGYGKHWLKKPAVVVKRDGREILNPATDEGRGEKAWRVFLMWVRQGGLCCFKDQPFCPGRLKLEDATFEHENKRGAGKHDSRLAIFDEEGNFVRHQNGAAHLLCNSIVGSRRLELYHGPWGAWELPGKEQGWE